MKRVDFDLTPDHELMIKGTGSYTVIVMFAAALLVVTLFATAASADVFAPCDKQKLGRSGQCYEWKKDC